MPDAAPASLAPAELAASYLRSVAISLKSFDEFASFLDALKQLVGEDRYLKGAAQLCDVFSGETKQPDFESLEQNETVIAIAGAKVSRGYLKYAGRADGRPFGAEDLHLMGAISSVVSALVEQAQNFRKKEQATSILQYLMNQLPLGVVCFDAQGSVLVENKLAQRLLGSSGVVLLKSQVAREGRENRDWVKLHLEVDGNLIYCEGRSLEVSEGVVINAYVLYDLSSSREKLLKDLELEAYLSESRGGAVVVALLESPAVAGEVYRKVKASAADYSLEPTKVQPLDAYTCACIFRGKDVRRVRYLLRQRLPCLALEDLRVALVGYDASVAVAEPAQGLLDAVSAALAQSDVALLPELLVLEIYPPVVDALEMIVGEECRLRTVDSIDAADALIRSGQVDGLILDVDGYGQAERERMQRAASSAGAGFKIFYSSYKQLQMARSTCGLSEGDTLLQKPFETQEVADLVRLQFNLA
ncbi:Unannotated [Lentimonas sp. CC11]|nr:Unannotated [Lentimonas sp. CC10]CAA7068479.1 Unannotated [Lentimonas sp. CC11]